MTQDSKPYSEACERNQGPILAVLQRIFTDPGLVLEIGSGTGQHAVHFARQLSHLVWQPTDIEPHLPGIRAWRDEARLDNLRPPLALDVNDESWPVAQADYVFAANTAHIMSWPEVQQMFRGIGRILAAGRTFCLYGPFNYHGAYTSDSNAHFDRHLKLRDPVMGIRDIDELTRLAGDSALMLVDDVAMPANNRTLVWEKRRVVTG